MTAFQLEMLSLFFVVYITDKIAFRLENSATIYLIIINLYAVFKMERYFICDTDNEKEWQHFKLKRCHSVGTA